MQNQEKEYRTEGVLVVTGDLIMKALEGQFDVIAHVANCQNVMGSGIAAQIRQEWREVFLIDREYYNSHHDKYLMMGNYSRFQAQVREGKWLDILNLYAQFTPGGNSPTSHIPLDYDALRICLRKVNQLSPGKSIGLPWLGCGLARASKSDVKALIVRELYNMNVTIVEYEAKRYMAGGGLGEGSSSGGSLYPGRGGATGEGFEDGFGSID